MAEVFFQGSIGKYPSQILRVDQWMVWGNGKSWVKQSPNGTYKVPHREEEHKGVLRSKLETWMFV